MENVYKFIVFPRRMYSSVAACFWQQICSTTMARSEGNYGEAKAHSTRCGDAFYHNYINTTATPTCLLLYISLINLKQIPQSRQTRRIFKAKLQAVTLACCEIMVQININKCTAAGAVRVLVFVIVVGCKLHT